MSSQMPEADRFPAPSPESSACAVPFLSRIGPMDIMVYHEEFIHAVQVGYLEHRLRYRGMHLSDVFLETLISSVLAQSCYSPARNAGWLVGWFMAFFERQPTRPRDPEARTTRREEELS
jgi:hypothetical protein